MGSDKSDKSKVLLQRWGIYRVHCVARLGALAITGDRLLYRLLRPELVYEWGDEGVEDGLQEPLVHPQEDRDHNAGDAHHAFNERLDPIKDNPVNERRGKTEKGTNTSEH